MVVHPFVCPLLLSVFFLHFCASLPSDDGIVPSSLLELHQLVDIGEPFGIVLAHWLNASRAPADVGMQAAMRDLRRMERQALIGLAPAGNRRRRKVKKLRAAAPQGRHIMVLEATSPNATNGGRCIISADQAVHFCGFEEEVNEPPIPPPFDGICMQSARSGRVICYPKYEGFVN
uniref:Secreted protein n=1 Tax=Globodera rostochiensis TaxID=31243 RepID=A0A914HVZ7_GLORO